MKTERIPINRLDDGELLGFVVQGAGGWQAQTVFGYTFARSADRNQVEQVVHEQGLTVLKGTWQYLDPDDGQWHPCILKDISPQQVTVIRTNAMGYQDPETTKLVTIKHPDETTLVVA